MIKKLFFATSLLMPGLADGGTRSADLSAQMIPGPTGVTSFQIFRKIDNERHQFLRHIGPNIVTARAFTSADNGAYSTVITALQGGHFGLLELSS